MYKKITAVVFFGVAAYFFWLWYQGTSQPSVPPAPVTSFEECVTAGNPVMESYPRQCRSAEGTLFVEDVEPVDPAVEDVREVAGSGAYEDMVEVLSPAPRGVITSPLVVTGQARGGWYFEATFPVTLVDWDGRIIAETYAEAQGEWMTESFVPFVSTIVFEKPYEVDGEVPEYMKRGWLIVKNANASGLPERDAAIEIPIRFEN